MAEFTRTFTVAVPVVRAWQVFTDSDERGQWSPSHHDVFEPEVGGRVSFEGPTAAVEGSVSEVVEERLLRWTEGPGLLPGETELTVTFEEVSNGTRITVTQSGFGDGPEWIGDLDAHARGWTQIMADFALYVETGVAARRAFEWKSKLGVAMYQTAAGVRAAWLVDGGACAQAGMQAEDLLLRVGSTPMFDITDVWSFVSGHDPGTEVEIHYVRGGEVLSGNGTLGG